MAQPGWPLAPCLPHPELSPLRNRLLTQGAAEGAGRGPLRAAWPRGRWTMAGTASEAPFQARAPTGTSWCGGREPRAKPAHGEKGEEEGLLKLPDSPVIRGPIWVSPELPGLRPARRPQVRQLQPEPPAASRVQSLDFKSRATVPFDVS